MGLFFDRVVADASRPIGGAAPRGLPQGEARGKAALEEVSEVVEVAPPPSGERGVPLGAGLDADAALPARAAAPGAGVESRVAAPRPSTEWRAPELARQREARPTRDPALQDAPNRTQSDDAPSPGVGAVGAWAEPLPTGPAARIEPARAARARQAAYALSGARLEDPSTSLAAHGASSAEAASTPYSAQLARLRRAAVEAVQSSALPDRLEGAAPAEHHTGAPLVVRAQERVHAAPERSTPPPPNELIIDRLDVTVIQDPPEPRVQHGPRSAPVRSGAWNTAARYYLR